MRLAKDRPYTHTGVGIARVYANACGAAIPMKKRKRHSNKHYRRSTTIERWASWILAALLFLIAICLLVAVFSSCTPSQPAFVDSIKP